MTSTWTPPKAIYPGTFDPLTMGHFELIRRAAALYGELVLGVAVAHHKRTLFSLEERLDMARRVTAELPGVTVAPFDGLLCDFVRAQGGRVVVRGVRTVADFEYEANMAGMNRELMPGVETVMMMPSDAYQFVSSTFVREIHTLGGDVSRLVPPFVLARLQDKTPSRA